MKKIRNTSSQWNTPEESKSEDVLKDELKLPHKKRITYERQPLKLDWARASTTNEDHSIL